MNDGLIPLRRGRRMLLLLRDLEREVILIPQVLPGLVERLLGRAVILLGAG